MTTLKAEQRTESAIVADCAEYLRRGRWFVTVHAQDRSVRRQNAGWVDISAFRYGVTLLVECKTRTGRRREAQERFYDSLDPHLGPCLWYVLARDVEALVSVTAEIARA